MATAPLRPSQIPQKWTFSRQYGTPVIENHKFVLSELSFPTIAKILAKFAQI